MKTVDDGSVGNTSTLRQRGRPVVGPIPVT
ncbi:MAG: hypothetical protein HW409_1102 [candidate division NC10 bacterium]|nr:hypothetical protein [candidate division NC10 bacterium]